MWKQIKYLVNIRSNRNCLLIAVNVVSLLFAKENKKKEKKMNSVYDECGNIFGQWSNDINYFCLTCSFFFSVLYWWTVIFGWRQLKLNNLVFFLKHFTKSSFTHYKFFFSLWFYYISLIFSIGFRSLVVIKNNMFFSSLSVSLSINRVHKIDFLWNQ